MDNTTKLNHRHIQSWCND